jgi:hypothetical protein
LGCGACPDAAIYHAVCPGARIVGADIDRVALKRARQLVFTAPWLWPLQADVRALPFKAGFDLLLVRHPDVDRFRSAWEQVLSVLPRFLTTPGWVLVTTYGVTEIEAARNWLSRTELTPVPLLEERLVGAGLAGRDRFALAWRK